MHGAARADRLHFAILQHAQQLDLRIERHFADFVEEDRAHVGGDELADMTVERAGEGAAFMTEQLRFDQVGRDGAAIDGHHRLLVARGSGMDSARDDILADAAFALDQHGHAGARRLGGDGEGGAELRRGADHILERQRGGDLLRQRAQFASGRPVGQRRVERGEQPFGRDRLRQIIGRAGAHRLHRHRYIVVRRQDQDRQGGTTSANVADQARWLIVRAPLVEDDRIQLHAILGTQHGDRRFAVGREDGAPSRTGSEGRHQPALRRFIVDQHHYGYAVARHYNPSS